MAAPLTCKLGLWEDHHASVGCYSHAPALLYSMPILRQYTYWTTGFDDAGSLRTFRVG